MVQGLLKHLALPGIRHQVAVAGKMLPEVIEWSSIERGLLAALLSAAPEDVMQAVRIILAGKPASPLIVIQKIKAGFI